MMLRKQLYIHVVILFYLFSIGCAAALVGAGAGAAGVVWYKGELQETLSGSITQVYEATNKGIKNLKIQITDKKSDDITAEIKGVLEDGKDVLIKLKYVSMSTTKISIRVGVFGDKTYSLRIMDEIKNHIE